MKVVRGQRPEKPQDQECPGQPLPPYLWDDIVIECWSHKAKDRLTMEGVANLLRSRFEYSRHAL
jgi:hypothetical protein